MSSRLETLATRIDAPMLVTDPVNITYLTGFESSNAALFVDPSAGATLYTDFRYIESARGTKGVEVKMVQRSGLLADVAAELSGAVQFEADAVSYAQWETLDRPGLQLLPVRGAVEELRAVKSEDEKQAIRRVAKVADRAFEALTAETFVGRTEKDIAWRLCELLHAHGADGVSFDPIVASGPNGALPHANPTDRIVETRALVVVDWGATLDGYCSDCTRTLSTGSPPARLLEAYEVCLAAQKAAVAGIRPTMTGIEADRIARAQIEEAGFGENFGHGLGHGLGMAVHELPRLSTESNDTLETGNVVTIEPGIYIEGLGGVRIEDLAIVTDDGVEIVTSFPKELVEVS